MSDFNGGSESHNFERLNRMEDVIQSMITLLHEQARSFSEQMNGLLEVIRESRLKVQELITLQDEHRIDIMALFELQKRRENG